MNMISFIKHGILAAAMVLIAGLGMAQVQIGLPINLPNSVEKSPALSLDGKHIVYISNENGGWQMFEAYLKPDGQWDDPMTIDSVNKFVSVPVKIDHPCFSGDGQRIYFAADYPGGKGGLDIYYTDLVNGKWSKPTNLGDPINSTANDDMPSIAADGQTIYFTRPNFEKKDEMLRCEKIWYADRNTNGSWKIAKPLPDMINSGCESSPRIFPDGKLLLFSSTREDRKQPNPQLKPKPGFDIYACKMIAKNVWTNPNLLYMMNTDGDDYSPNYSSVSKNIYYSVTKDLKGQISGGIYTVKTPDTLNITKQLVVSGTMTDGATGKALVGTVKVTDMMTQKEICTYQTSSIDGSYYLSLNPGANYLLDFTAPNYSHQLKTEEYPTASATDKQEKLNVRLFSLLKFKMKVYDSESFDPLDARIKLSAQSPSQIPNLRFEQDASSIYRFALPLNRKYVLQIEAPNFQSQSLPIDLTYDVQLQDMELDVPVSPARDVFEVNITDQNSQAVDAEIEATEQRTGEIIHSANDISGNLVRKVGNGKFELKLHLGNTYWVEPIAAKNQMTAGEMVEAIETSDKKINIKMATLNVGSTLLLKEVKFTGNTAELAASSDKFLMKLYLYLLENPQLKCEFNGYCNDKPSDELALKLTKQRAQAVVDYLMARGVKANRLTAKGNGKNTPLVPNDSDANRLKNERIELKIVE